MKQKVDVYINWTGKDFLACKTSSVIKKRFQSTKTTRAASQAGDDADTSRTPGFNSSVQTSLNDHGVCYYLCYNIRVHQLFRIL